MKFEQVDARTIRVVLTDQDMSDYTLDYEQMDYNDQTTRKAILKILQKMQKKIPLDVENHKLFIEAFPGTEEGCILYVNIIEFDKNNQMQYTERLSFDTPIIFSFDELNTVTTICRRLLREYDDLIIKSSLFFYEKNYYLLLYSHSRMEKKTICILEEYGSYFGKGAVLAAFLCEHGKEISHNNAIETIVYYLS